MKKIEIKDVMIELSDYATISEKDNLASAIKALQKAQNDSKYNYKHRCVLALNDEGQISGKLSMFDILKSLEPKYQHFEHSDLTLGHIGLSRFGLSQQFLNSLVGCFDLWSDPLDELVKKAGKQPVKDFMYSPTKGEYVKLEADISEAIHQFILGCHQSLLVLKDRKVVGVVRLSDIFNLICEITPL